MNFVWGLICGIAISTIVCLLWPKKVVTKTIEKIVCANEDEAKKQENLKNIEDYIIDKKKFTNDELQKIVGVSDTTIGRYLQELEDLKIIKQVGKTGQSVHYEKV